MRIGIGIPSMIPGTDGPTVVKWAKAGDAGPFSSLTTIDRVCFGNAEPVTALAAAAAVTERVKLMTTVLLAGVREPVMLAKQLATLDVLSGGRVVLGIGVGSRPDDFAATGQPYHNRGRRVERTIEIMRQVWRGEPVSAEAGPVGPLPVQPGGPPILLGAIAERAIARIGKCADGFIGAGGLERGVAIVEQVKAHWRAQGRPGTPILVASLYFALGPDTQARGSAYIRSYYSSSMTQAAEAVVGGLITTRQAVTTAIERLEEAGYDEVSFWPTVADLDEVERLADAVA
jgi:alkanesulfonate monooxygenase SsuD/methylene tetrahydromethanopterin reductase-like flavin-dependent oxidoreductase (luciferase family)